MSLGSLRRSIYSQTTKGRDFCVRYWHSEARGSRFERGRYSPDAPFETVRSFWSPIIEVQHFLPGYRLHSYSMARQIAEVPTLAAGRKLLASAGAEEDASRELLRLRPR